MFGQGENCKHNEMNLPIDADMLASSTDEEMLLRLDQFADKTDNEIQNHLVSELMAKYADVSKQIEVQNEQLQIYSKHLEDLVEEKVHEISASQVATIHALVKAAEARDDDTGKHVERTSQYCKLIAQKLYAAGLYPDIVDETFADNIEKASPLHDIGKIGIADAVLLKPGRLTDEEFAIMKTHVDIGYDTLSSASASYPGNIFLRMGIDIAKYHQEKYNGSGYMEGLSGEDIPLSARIMAVADVYDALRSKRVYKDGFSHEKSRAIILEGRGSHFDPVLVDIFEKNDEQFCEIFDRMSA